MNRATRWLSLLCAVGVGFVAVSCDEESPTSVQEVTTPTTAETAADAAETPSFVEIAADPVFNCLNDLPGAPDSRFNNATCTANDVRIKILDVLAVNGEPQNGPIECVEGESLEVEFRAFFGLNGKDRFDIAYWFKTAGGGEDARTGECVHGILEPLENGTRDPTGGPPYDGPYTNLEPEDAADICGDATTADEVSLFGEVIAAVKDIPELVTLTCTDPDDDGFIKVGTCTSWDNNDKDSCTEVADAVPGTPSKCNCDPALVPVNIRREATVKVIKDIVEDDGSLWTLTIASPSLASDVTDDVGDLGEIEATIQWFKDDEPGANKATVTEAYHSLGAGSDAFYTSTYSCDSTNDAHDISTTSGRSIPEFTDLVNNESIVCTFVNTRIPVPTVTVSKTANTTYDKTWDWTIDKRAFFTANDQEISSGTILGAGPPIALPGMVYDVYYVVSGAPTATESDFKVSGVITVTVTGSLPPYSGNFTVTDVLPGATNLVVDCDPGEPVSNTKTVTAAGSFTCDYSADLPDKTTRTNTATAAVTWNSGDTDSQNGTASVTFGAPTNEIDETAYICDDKGPTLSVSDPCTTSSGDYLGTATAPSSYSFRYDNDLPACVPPGFDRLNTALLTEVDTDTDRTANHALSSVCQDPPPGCTLTQGYWKTHSEYGPAPYDDNWANLPGGADTQLDNSSDSWYEAFHTPPKGGNAWYQLAHQWMAATLNVLNEAGTTTEVDAALTRGYELLDQYGAQKKIPKRSDDAAEAKDLARLLTQYNEGAIGPGHCDDDQWPDSYFAP